MTEYPRPDDLARAAAGDPPEPLYTTAETVGIVKFWHDDKGYGAIASERTAPWDIWCHFSAIDAQGYRALTPAERVQVGYRRANQESFRYVAEYVRRFAPDAQPDTTTHDAG